MNLLQQRERDYQHIFSDLGIPHPPKISPSEHHPKNQVERNVEITSRSIQLNPINSMPNSPHPTGHLKRPGGASPRRETLKHPKVQSASLNTKVVPSSSSCPLCHEGPYGLMVRVYHTLLN
jgi:hypothetical protein